MSTLAYSLKSDHAEASPKKTIQPTSGGSELTIEARNFGIRSTFQSSPAYKRLSQFLQDFVADPAENGKTSTDIVERTIFQLLLFAKVLGYQLPVPDASVGPEGQILLIWDNADHHLELETTVEGASLFYANRSTGSWWGQPQSFGMPSPEAVEKLNLVSL